MKINLILIIQLFVASSCMSQGANSLEGVKKYVFEANVYSDAKSHNAILVTPILDKNDFGIYVFKKKGPHENNRLLFRQVNKYEIIDKDSSISFIESRTTEFLASNELTKSEKNEVKRQIQELILDYKESSFIK